MINKRSNSNSYSFRKLSLDRNMVPQQIYSFF